MYSLQAIEALAADTLALNVALSPMSATLILAAYDELAKIYRWFGAGDELSTGERDEIDAILATLYDEITTGIVMPAETPLGHVFAFAGAAAATTLGCLECDGAAYTKTAYPDLYAALHSAFIVDANNFIVPDLRGRAVLGLGQGTGLTNRAMGASGGTESHQLTSAEMPSHTHVQKTLTSTSGAISGTVNSVDTTAGNIANDQVTGATGADGAHNNMPPFRVLRYLIKALP